MPEKSLKLEATVRVGISFYLTLKDIIRVDGVYEIEFYLDGDLKQKARNCGVSEKLLIDAIFAKAKELLARLVEIPADKFDNPRITSLPTENILQVSTKYPDLDINDVWKKWHRLSAR